MIVIRGPTAYFDVDDTLVLWSPTEEQLKHAVPFNVTDAFFEGEGVAPWIEMLVPHYPHVEQLKKHAIRGQKVIVWSAGGAEWAAAVIKQLDLEHYVTLAIDKPDWAYDDLDAKGILPKIQLMPWAPPKN